MTKERGNPEIARTFRAMGGEARKDSDLERSLRATGKFKGAIAPSGRADYTWILPPFGGYIEAKSADTHFAFSELSPEQRLWLTERQSISWLWLWMGHDRPGSKSEFVRTVYLVPWSEWVQWELVFNAHDLKGLSYSTPHRLIDRENGHFAKRCLAPYELRWGQYGVWKIPEGHAFWIAPHHLIHQFGPSTEKGYDVSGLDA